jgi:hypothetical protein
MAQPLFPILKPVLPVRVNGFLLVGFKNGGQEISA